MELQICANDTPITSAQKFVYADDHYDCIRPICARLFFDAIKTNLEFIEQFNG